MRTYARSLRFASAVALFFFVWTYLPLFEVVAFAATQQKTAARGRKTDGRTGVSPVLGPAERFEKALEDIHEKVGKLALSKVKGAEDITSEIEAIKKQRIEIEKIDIELKKEFAATEKKLKDAKLPQEILDRHYKFVKHYEDNLAELKTNLSAIEKPSAKSNELRAALQKAKAHLEKTKPPKKHVPLDPNNLPFRARKAAKTREPRLDRKSFERDFQQQNKKNLTAHLPQSTQSAQRTAQWIPDAGYTIQDILNRASWNMHPESVQFGRELARIITNGNPYWSGVAAEPAPYLIRGFSLRERPTARQKPILLAFNGPVSDIPLSLPLPSRGEGWGEGGIPQSEISNPQWSIPHLDIPNTEPGTLNLALASSSDATTADDLAETPEIQFTPDIRAKAQELGGNPVKIYEWVRNNIEYAPTYGSIQGADMCLQSKICNDIDTAACLSLSSAYLVSTRTTSMEQSRFQSKKP